MDKNRLVDEILERVSVKLADLESRNSITNKKRILILAEQHGTKCHELLDNSNLQTCLHTECALLKEYNCDIMDYDAVVIYHLSINALSKLASGVCDTPFISLASKAILMGKKVVIPNEEIELNQYEQTAPSAYYAMMNEKLRLLKDSGVIFCSYSDVESILMGDCQKPACCVKETNSINETNPMKERKTVKVDKKIITERDLKKFELESLDSICINSNSILTDLAKDYLNYKKIEIVRELTTGRKQR
jgi:ethanolamine utilization protein